MHEIVRSLRHEVKPTLRDAALVICAGCLLAFGTNAVRRNSLPLVQKQDYAILVPCSEPEADPEPMNPGDARLLDRRSLVLDVRSPEEFTGWHVEGARNQPFDWLGPPVDNEVKQVAQQTAASRAHRVVVYGDGDDPDSGQEWAKLLSGARIKNVFFVRGGAPALNPEIPKPPGAAPPTTPSSDSLLLGPDDSDDPPPSAPADLESASSPNEPTVDAGEADSAPMEEP